MNLPTVDELRARARRALEATGADVDLGEPGGHGLSASTPITGEVLFTVPHTSATAAFHAHTATGKLNAVITPTTPSGCQVSSRRCPGRSDAMVRP